jgi:L,D-transpeptidase catalytic domain
MKHALCVSAARLGYVVVVVGLVLLTLGIGEATTTADGKAMAGGKASTFTAAAWMASEVGNIGDEVLRLALGASQCAVSAGAVASPRTLTIIDYSKPSVEPRLWVLDLQLRKLLYEELVAHGQGSGGNLATTFSNRPESHQTSLGLFVTDSTYTGRNGYSLRLTGLDAGFNDRARERAIVMHGAPYVNAQIGKSLGRLGRSHGCPAVREAVAHELINRVKGGNLVFAYYPDQKWLNSSKFLSCSA